MSRAAGPRFPFAPFEEYLRRQGVDPARRAHGIGVGDTKFPDQMRAVLGVSTHQIMSYRKRGVGPVLADELAVRVGVHPGEIWPEFHDWDPETDEEKRQRRLEGNRESHARRRIADKNRKAV